MPTAFDVRALDSVVRVELDDSLPQADRDLIRSQWIDLIEEGAPPSVRVVGALGERPTRYDPSVRVVSARSTKRLAALLATEITLAGITELSGTALMLHAGAIALDDGRVVALVGPSGRGKTTAAQALGRSFAYVTDETLAVFPDGTVVPYRKPLSVGRHPDSKTQLAASGLGLRDLPSAPLRLDAIIVLDRRDRVDAPRVEQIPLLEALDEIVPQTSFLSQLARPLRGLVETIVSTGGVRRVVYSEAETLSGLMEDLLAADSSERPHLVEVNAPASDCNCGSGNLSPAAAGTDVRGDAGLVYRRSDYRDALSVDDALVVLSRNRVTVLDGLGPILWFAAENLTEAELADAALREMPAPPSHVDPAEVVAVAVGELVEARLLTRVSASELAATSA